MRNSMVHTVNYWALYTWSMIVLDIKDYCCWNSTKHKLKNVADIMYLVYYIIINYKTFLFIK